MEYRMRETDDMPNGGPGISHLSELAESMRDDALAFALSQRGTRKPVRSLQRVFDEIEFVDCFKYSLAQSLCEVLAAHAVQIREIHYYDPLVESTAQPVGNLPVDASLHLLARISRSSAALEMFISALDQAMVECLKELPTPLFAETNSIIDISLITDDDVRLGRGQAKLLSSMYTPPLRIFLAHSFTPCQERLFC
jgi:hypothetical protein